MPAAAGSNAGSTGTHPAGLLLEDGWQSGRTEEEGGDLVRLSPRKKLILLSSNSDLCNILCDIYT